MFTSSLFGNVNIRSHRPATGRAAAAAALLLLALVPAAAQEKKSSLANPGSPAAAAASESPKEDSIKKVAQLIDGMGYTVKGSGADYLIIQANNLVVALEPASDGSSIYASIYFDLPKDKIAVMPYEKILEYNGLSADYFGTSKSSNGDMSIALMNHLAVAQLSPRSLKDLIDEVTGDANRNLDLLDPSGWKSALPNFTAK